MTNAKLTTLAEDIGSVLGDAMLSHHIALDELTIEVAASAIKDSCLKLRDQAGFDQLTDLCGMDYSGYGAEGGDPWPGERFAVIYHLISYNNNARVRIRAQLSEANLMIDSVIDVWAGAEVEMRFDEEQGRVIYQPVTIDPRVLVPRTIRKDVFAKAATEEPVSEDNA